MYLALKDDMWYTSLRPPTKVLLTVNNTALVVVLGAIFTTAVPVTMTLLVGSVGISIGVFFLYLLYRSSTTVYEQQDQYHEDQEEFEEVLERNKEILRQVKTVNTLLEQANVSMEIHEPDQIDFVYRDLTKIQSDAREAQEKFQEEDNMEGGRRVIDLLQELQEYGSEYKFVIR
jgi:uncharacterized membrane protein (DUF106 family)